MCVCVWHRCTRSPNPLHVHIVSAFTYVYIQRTWRKFGAHSGCFAKHLSTYRLPTGISPVPKMASTILPLGRGALYLLSWAGCPPELLNIHMYHYQYFSISLINRKSFYDFANLNIIQNINIPPIYKFFKQFQVDCP